MGKVISSRPLLLLCIFFVKVKSVFVVVLASFEGKLVSQSQFSCLTYWGLFSALLLSVFQLVVSRGRALANYSWGQRGKESDMWEGHFLT